MSEGNTKTTSTRRRSSKAASNLKVFVWRRRYSGALAVVAKNEKEARKAALEKSPVASQFFGMEPEVLTIEAGAVALLRGR